MPSQRPQISEYTGISRNEFEQAAWLVLPDGTRYRGAAAINGVLGVVFNSRVPLWVYNLPLIHQLQDWGYAWVARNRHRFPGTTPHCQQFPADCHDATADK